MKSVDDSKPRVSSTPAGDPDVPCAPCGPGSRRAEPRGLQGPGPARRPQEGRAAQPHPERQCPRLLLPLAWTPFTEQAARTPCPGGRLALTGERVCGAAARDQFPACTAGRQGPVRPRPLAEGLKLGGLVKKKSLIYKIRIRCESRCLLISCFVFAAGCGGWCLSPLTRNRTCAPCRGRLNLWTAREVSQTPPRLFFFFFLVTRVYLD